MRRLLRLFGLLLACLGAATSGNATAAGRVALVIGNAAYADAPLPNPANDARAMADRLDRLGFSVQVLTDADRAAMERALVEFSGRLDAETTALFYYAGHGIQSNGRNYLLPVDAKVRSEAALRFEALDVGDVLDELARSGSRVNFVILDACRNNPFERKVRGGGSGLAAIDAARGTLIAYATAPGSVAIDGESSNGLYTSELLKALDAPGLKAEELFKRVRIAVSDQSAGLQVPWESSSLTGDFVFNRDAAPAPPTAAAPDPAPASSQASMEQSLWAGVREMDSPAAYRAYLEQYPEGVFAALARLKLDRAGPPPSRAAGGQCELAGPWRNSVPSAGCEASTLRFTRREDGNYDMVEEGCGNVRGEARYVGEVLVIDWVYGGFVCKGRTELRFEPDCRQASGEVVMPADFLGCSGRHAATLTRLGAPAERRASGGVD